MRCHPDRAALQLLRVAPRRRPSSSAAALHAVAMRVSTRSAAAAHRVSLPMLRCALQAAAVGVVLGQNCQHVQNRCRPAMCQPALAGDDATSPPGADDASAGASRSAGAATTRSAAVSVSTAAEGSDVEQGGTDQTACGGNIAAPMATRAGGRLLDVLLGVWLSSLIGNATQWPNAAALFMTMLPALTRAFIWEGQSAGQRLLAIKVVRTDGRTLGWPMAVMRELLWIVTNLVRAAPCSHGMHLPTFCLAYPSSVHPLASLPVLHCLQDLLPAFLPVIAQSHSCPSRKQQCRLSRALAAQVCGSNVIHQLWSGVGIPDRILETEVIRVR